MQNKGFSLVEFLVVIAIIGLISSIGLAQFGEYRKRGNDIAAVSDVRNIVAELYNDFENGEFFDESELPTPRLSKDVSYRIEITNAESKDGFIAYTWHNKGTSTWCYENNGPGRELGRKGLSKKKGLGVRCSDGSEL